MTVGARLLTDSVSFQASQATETESLADKASLTTSNTFQEMQTAPVHSADRGAGGGTVRIWGAIDDSATGYLEINNPDGTRSGYIGDNAPGGATIYHNDAEEGHAFNSPVMAPNFVGNFGGSPVTVRPATSTYDAAPAIIAPASTPTLTLNGKTTPGDYPEQAGNRQVSSQPSHQGFIEINGVFYELMGGHACPDHFIRTGDADDSASWLRMRDYMIAKNLLLAQLGARTYDIRAQQVDFSNIAIQLLGHGYTESGKVPAPPNSSGYVNGNFTQWVNTAYGTWVLAGNTGFKNLAFNSGASRGSSIRRLGFCQNHPTPASNWTPIAYDSIIDNTQSLGSLKLDELMFLGINKGVHNFQSGRLELGRIQSQFFTEGFYIDNAQDKCFITGKIDNWSSYLTGDANVIMFQQSTGKLFRIGRCDGLLATGAVFSLGMLSTISYENLSSNGPATDQIWSTVYSDLSKFAVNNDNAGTFANFAYLKGQCQSQAGPNISGGATVNHTSNAVGGQIKYSQFRSERTDAGAIVNAGSCGNTISGQAELLYSTAAKQFSSSNGTVTTLSLAPFTDSTATTYGTQGVDWVLTDNEIIYEFSGTSDANGNYTLSVTSDSTFQPSLYGAFAIVKNTSNGAGHVMVAADTSNVAISFTSNNTAFANAPVRGNYRRRRYPSSW